MNKYIIPLMLILSACSTPQAGPDKTLAGAVLGAGWGAGAGAVVGHQLTPTSQAGEGVAIGAGLGLVSGALQGAGYDVIEEDQIAQEQQLASLQIQNATNAKMLAAIQDRLDREPQFELTSNVYQVNFGPDETSVKSGAIANLEEIANAITGSSRPLQVFVEGHTDDTGDKDYNQKVSEARASNVATYLMARGISQKQIQIQSYGAERPLVSNSTKEGRQLNRRVEVFVRAQ